MPMPVSTTSKQTTGFSEAAASARTTSRTLPPGENFSALPMRFTRICCSRERSLRMTSGTSPSKSTLSGTAVVMLRCRIRSKVSASSGNSLNLEGRTCSLPASTLERSKMSLMIFSRKRPLRATVLR